MPNTGGSSFCLTMKYEKPFLPISDQVNLLEARGLIIDDRDKAEFYLANISYYRLSAYMLPFKNKGLETFLEGTTFSKILDAYVFDRELRLLVFDAIERIEIAFRTQAIYHPAKACGPMWYEDEANYLNKAGLVECFKTIDYEIERSKEIFIQHFKTKYCDQNRPPAWIMFELLPFGLVSRMCFNLSDYTVREAIGVHFGFKSTQRDIFESWLQTLVYVRNVCAHHSRLWNRNLVNPPRMMKTTPHPWIKRNDISIRKLYYFLCTVMYLLSRINPETSFATRLKALIDDYSHLPISDMDFPANWESEPVWNLEK